MGNRIALYLQLNWHYDSNLLYLMAPPASGMALGDILLEKEILPNVRLF